MKKFGILVLAIILFVPCAIFFGCGAQTESLAFTLSTKTIAVDETYNLETTSEPADLKITYSVADSTIALLLPNGTSVLGLKEGQTKIYATTKNGTVAEMTLSVGAIKSALSAPTGLSFTGQTRIIRWINVLNAYKYEVTVENQGQIRTYEVLTNSFCFDDFDLNYTEYSEYKVTVKAKAAANSKVYSNSENSGVLNLKQIYSVSDLKYLEGKIVFEYDISSLNVTETGNVSFNLEILKNGISMDNKNITSSNLQDGKIRFEYAPTEVGQYVVRVYAYCENLQNSKIKEINVIKLSSPLITTNGNVVSVSGGSEDSFKYFKTAGGVREEISISELTIGSLNSGEEIVYEAYSLKQNSGNSFYVDSDSVSLTIKKLETPYNLKLEKLSGNNKSIRLVWTALLPIENYDIYLNGIAISKSTYSTESGLHKLILSNSFADSGTYTIKIIASKNQTESIYYLTSAESNEVTVVKLATPTVGYDSSTNNFILNSPAINFGAIFNFTATYKNETFRIENETISGAVKNFTLSGLNINLAGICTTTTKVSRNSENDSIVYLDSENALFNVNKMESPDLAYTYSNILNGKMILSWPAILGAGSYSIQIKNLTDNILVNYTAGTITNNNGILSLEINVFENGKEYQIEVKALSAKDTETVAGTSTKFLGSEISTLAVVKLAAPTVTVSSKSVKSINFTWNAVNRADKYNVYIDGILKLSTTSPGCSVSVSGSGSHSIYVVAISDSNNVIPCNIVPEINNISYFALSQAEDITYSKTTDENAYISFKEVENADGYKLVIIDTDSTEWSFTSSSRSSGRVSFLIPTSIFDQEGIYTVYVYATSGESNIVENERVEKQIRMLESVSSIRIDEADNVFIVWEYEGDIAVSGYDIYINGVLVTDYEFKDSNGNIQMKYDISGLSPNTYNIIIVAKGDNVSTIDSSAFTASIKKKENLDAPSILGFSLKDSGVNSDFKLTFSRVPNADYYIIYILDQSGNATHSIQVDQIAAENISYALGRNLFESDMLQDLYVKAIAVESPIYANSVPDFADANQVLKIYKTAQMGDITVSEDETKINLNGLQAFINDNLFKNTNLSIPTLASGESLALKVRKIGTYIDSMVDGIFYMAGDWKDFEIIRLETPTVDIDAVSKTITWNNSSTVNVINYGITIQFFRLDGTEREEINLILPTAENSLTYGEIVDLVLENYSEELINYAGNYKIYVKAFPVAQTDGKIYLTSSNSSNEVDFIISGTLSSELVSAGLLPEGIMKLAMTRNNGNFVASIELLIEQGGNSAKLKFSRNGIIPIIEVLNNSLNNYSGIYNVYESNGIVYLLIDIQAILNEGEFSVSWNIFGDGVYADSATGTDSLNSYKLKTPILEYSNDQYGNYIKIDQTIYSSYDESVVFYAEYEGQELTFINGKLLLPYSWTDLSKIYIYAIKEGISGNGTIMSDDAIVNIELYEQVTNIRLETDVSDSDKTFLKWDSQGEEDSWIVYIYHSQATSIFTVNSTELELTSIVLPYAGQYTFKIAAYGNNSTLYNSKLVEFTAKKLAADITLSNTNGVLNWSLGSTQPNVTAFRININGTTKIDFGAEIRSDSLSAYSGLFDLQIRMVGNISENTISSDYTNVVKFYKFESPTTFKIKEGQFNFGDEGDIYVTDGLFRIVIGDKTYSYQTVTGIEHISVFYNSDVLTGTAKAFVSGGKVITIEEVSVLTLNSNITAESKTFNKLVVETSNEEQYLIQSITDGKATTCFNWSWTESGNVTTRNAIIYIKPDGNITAPTFAGWDKKYREDGYLDYYYRTVSVSYVHNETENTTTFTVELDLPEELVSATEYVINVQKSDTSLDGTYLSSKLNTAINFYQLTTPSLSLKDGKLSWVNQSLATAFWLPYTGSSTGPIELGKAVSYELGAGFADSNIAKTYYFKILALGNVPSEKPESLPTSGYKYVISSQTSSQKTVVKPRTAGDLKLTNGSLGWADAGYHFYRSSGAIFEFVFYDSGENLVATTTISADKFTTLFPNNTSNILLEDILNTVKGSFKAGEKYTIKYRELGSTTFANSEYKDLANNIVVEGQPEVSKYFKFAPTITNISISNNGLIWTPVTVASGELTTIYYDIFFTLNDESHVYATSTNNTSVSIESIKGLDAFKNNVGSIKNVFVVVRGDSNNYISGFNSPTVSVKAITGDISLGIEEGVIYWNSVQFAGSYEIKTTISSQTVVYKIYKEDSSYYVEKRVDGELVLTKESSFIQLNGTTWTWDWAQDEIIDANTQYSLYIRYNPDGNGVFPIPGDYTSVAVKVYKLAAVEPTIVDGSLSWTGVPNASKYTIRIKYLDADDNQIELEEFDTTLTTLSLLIFDKGQTSIQISVQAIGPTETTNEINYINTVIVYNTVKLKSNSITNFSREEDVIEWGESESSYEIMIYDSENNFIGNYAVSGKQYDLSALKLSSLKSYIVYVKVKGSSGPVGEDGTGYLSSKVFGTSISFNVLQAVESVQISDGEIVWEPVSEETNYKISISSGSGYTYVYIIEKDNEIYKISSLSATKNNITNAIVTTTSSITVNEGYIQFWSSEMEEGYSSTISVVTVGHGDYVSSEPRGFGSTFSKASSSTLAPSASYDETTGIITLTWKRNNNYLYEIVVQDEDGNVVYSADKIETGSLTIDTNDSEVLSSGEYTFKVRRYSSETNATTIKSNYKTASFTIPEEEIENDD